MAYYIVHLRDSPIKVVRGINEARELSGCIPQSGFYKANWLGAYFTQRKINAVRNTNQGIEKM